MVLINFNVPDETKVRFETLVGKGNVSRILRDFVTDYAGVGTNEEKDHILRKLQILEHDHNKYHELKLELESIEAKERAEEKLKLEAERKEHQRKLKEAEAMADSVIASGAVGRLGQ